MKVRTPAKKLDTTADTVRYYTRLGLLSPDKDRVNGYQHFSKKDQARLRFILSARQLNFSVDEIEQILSEADKGKSACPLVREIVERRLKVTEKQFQQTMRLRAKLQKAIADWQSKPIKPQRDI